MLGAPLSHRRHGGFTLIEAMITLVVIGILTSLAYASYQDQMRKARRADATTIVLELGSRLEKYYNACGSYTANIDKPLPGNCDTPAAIGLGLTGTESAAGYYQLAVTDLNPADGATNTIGAGFRVTATPVAGRLQKDDGFFVLTSDGRRQFDANKNGTIEANENQWP